MSLRNKFKNQEIQFAAWTSLGHPSITEMFGQAPFDWIGIDMEHSTISLEQAQNIISMAQGLGKCCLPRVSSHNGEQIRRLLDAGADGVIVPQVSNAKELKQIVSWVKYPPKGTRGFGVARAQKYGWEFDKNAKEWNGRSVIIAQIESIEAVIEIDDLLSNPDLDGVMVGPYDLSGSIGIPGQITHEKVQDACQKVLNACKKHGKPCGTQLIDPNQTEVDKAIQDGFTFIILSSDVFLMWKWGESMKTLIESSKTKKESVVNGQQH